MKYLKSILLIGGISLVITILLSIPVHSLIFSRQTASAEEDSDPSYFSIYAMPKQRISIDRNPDAHRYRPQVVFNYNHNEYLVVWHNTYASGIRYPYARRLDINGKPIGDVFVLSNIVTNQVHPFVVYNGTDDVYFVVWMYDVSMTGSRYEIWGSILPWNATTCSDPFRIAHFEDPALDLWYPSAAWNSLHNEYLVIWDARFENNHNSIGFQRVDSDETLLTSGTITIVKAPHESDIVYNSTADQYLVVWTRKIDDVSLYNYIQGALLNWDASIYDIDALIYGECEDQGNPAVATAMSYYNIAFSCWYHDDPVLPSWVFSNIYDLNLQFLDFKFWASLNFEVLNPDITAKGSDGEWLFTWEMIETTGNTIKGFRYKYPSTHGSDVYQINDVSWYYRDPAVIGGGPGYLLTYTGRDSDPNHWQHIYATKIWQYADFLPLVFK